MNPTGKLNLDTLLGSWPAPTRDDRAWEERADAIVKAALAAAADPSSPAPSPALFEAPPLAAEQGEPQAPIASAGEKKMSQESDPIAPKTESIPPSAAAPSTVSPARPSERKRGSLKEMAARASQAGASARPATSSTLPAPPSRTGGSATSSPLPSASSVSSARPAEAGKEDSGIVNLSSIKSAATEEQKAAAEKAKPASEGIFEEEDKDKAAAAAAVAPVIPISAAKTSAASAKSAAAAEKKKGSSGVVVGGIIAVLGLAAAFAITKVNKPETPPPAPIAAESKPASTDVKTETAQPQKAGEGSAPVAQAPSEPAAAEKPGQDTAKVAAAPQGAGAVSAPAASTSAAPDTEEKPAAAPTAEAVAAAPAAPSKPGDLKGAMAQAVGADGSTKTAPTSDNAEPASGPRNQNIPEKPSQGSVQAAIGTVMGGAKACVAGADDVSRAQITFASNGSVSNVSVTGWAAAHSATGCVKAALKGAKVGAFSSSSFSVGVTIRP